jgi:hypothetical protein
MAVLQSFNIPTTAIPLGPSTFGPFAVPAGVNEVAFNVPVAGLVIGTFYADYRLEASVDGGATWRFVGAAGVMGSNTVSPKTGTTDEYTRFGPMPAGGLVRLVLTCLVAFTLTNARIDLLS